MKPDQALISAPSSPRECLKEQYEGTEKHRRKEKLPQVTPLDFPLRFINQIRMTQPPLATEEAEDKDAVSQTKMKMQMEQKTQSVSAQGEDRSSSCVTQRPPEWVLPDEGQLSGQSTLSVTQVRDEVRRTPFLSPLSSETLLHWKPAPQCQYYFSSVQSLSRVGLFATP